MSKDDGGPAFPRNVLDHGHGVTSTHESGMSLRDWFAGQIACSVMTATLSPDATPDTVAAACYVMADALLKARKL